jgi:hypothetical protein
MAFGITPATYWPLNYWPISTAAPPADTRSFVVPNILNAGVVTSPVYKTVHEGAEVTAYLIVESYDDSGVHVEKRSDGSMVQYGAIAFDLAVNVAYGALYRSAVQTGPSYVESFYEAPNYIAGLCNTSVLLFYACTNGGDTATDGATWYALAGSSGTNRTGTMRWRAEGRWRA